MGRLLRPAEPVAAAPHPKARGGGVGASGSFANTDGVGGSGGTSLISTALEGAPCSGYTLIGSPENDAGQDFKAQLIDMDGNVVHSWPITGFPPKMLPGGALIGCSGVFPGSYDCVEIRQVAWDGAPEWAYSSWEEASGISGARQHHDFERGAHQLGYYAPGATYPTWGKTLVLGHARRNVPGLRVDDLDDDVIYEVDESGQLTGFIWYGADHVADFGFDQAALDDIATRNPGGVLEWLHGNSISRVGPNRWFDAGHQAFHPHNLIYSSRAASFVAIIEMPSGDVVWRIGPDFAGRPEEALGQFAGQHHPHVIPEGLPGAGNMLVFDNGGPSGYGGTEPGGLPSRFSRSYSRVLEFNPITFEVVWQYGAADSAETFSSVFLSNAQRLPNGNTMITIGTKGRLIEVTPENKVVWEYQYQAASSGANAGWLYRAYRIPPEWLPDEVNRAKYQSWASLFE